MLTGGGSGGGGGGGGGRGKGPAGAALVGSAVAAPAVWRRTGAAGAPPAGARSHPGRASSRGASGRARCAQGLREPRAAAASELVPRGLAGGAARARPASPAPARLLPLAVGASAAAGDTRRTGARAEPSPSRRRRRRYCALLPGSLPARGPGCGGRRAGGARAGQGAHSGVGAEDRTLSREGPLYRSRAPQMRSSWRKEEEEQEALS
ncbi:AT-rich interactive domain-containing protein 1B-like isoform X1 [Sapajus apella]|uniref:AT-rich interactive domain-containing protein 1B-like isoform X1 n=1 Tax=Sapajus apella TaxID=9515 RepID=A0A6J3GBG3_SAPAP|nr:AT-rich interactive domain-containing protein 1B-like isoform X1 [Sapajus apella]XP_032115360.1 AT-rich interactive domain-containing protein 1B-like isoform X1 [Sapajus apella]